MLNFGVDLPYLPPRDDHPRPSRRALLHPQPATSAVNEQRARARLHACNEASAAVACADAVAVASKRGVRLETHWARALSYDFFARGDAGLRAGAHRGAHPARVARRRRHGLPALGAAVFQLVKRALRVARARLRATFPARRFVCRG
jgi:hypothetical protein